MSPDSSPFTPSLADADSVSAKVLRPDKARQRQAGSHKGLLAPTPYQLHQFE